MLTERSEWHNAPGCVPVSRTLSGAQRIPALTSSMAAMIPGVSQPEIQRQVRQQRADIDALYELVERVDPACQGELSPLVHSKSA